MSTGIKVTPSSGNVFADLNLPNPEERLVKATIALSIGELIEKRGLTQEEAGTILGLPQPSVLEPSSGQTREVHNRPAAPLHAEARLRCHYQF